MGISPGRTRPYTHRPEWERERAHQRTSISRLAAQDSLRKNVSKEVCFWLWGKDNLVQLPKRIHRYVNSGYSLFFRGSNGVSQVFVDERFINKAQFDAGFAHRLILKDGAVPAIKDPGHNSELQMVSETASNVCVLLEIRASAHHSLAPPTRHASRSSAFFGENRKSVSFFYKYDKTKDFLEIWRMQYYSIGTQD